MITLQPADPADLRWAQRQVTAHHYLRAPVDVRSRPLAYLVHCGGACVGCLIFGRPEATRCYDGALTYGSQADVAAGRAEFDRWEVLNLSRVWLDPIVQRGGQWYGAACLPGFLDRRGVWRSTLVSHVIGLTLARVGYDYLAQHPPVDCAYPYAIRTVLSYCDTRRHKGTIYRAAGFQLARTNGRGIQTWYSTAVASLSAEQDADIQRLAERSPRSVRIRAERAVVQERLL